MGQNAESYSLKIFRLCCSYILCTRVLLSHLKCCWNPWYSACAGYWSSCSTVYCFSTPIGWLSGVAVRPPRLTTTGVRRYPSAFAYNVYHGHYRRILFVKLCELYSVQFKKRNQRRLVFVGPQSCDTRL